METPSSCTTRESLWHFGNVDNSHLSRRFSSYRKDIQIHACWFWRSLNACKMHMLIEFDLDGPQGHRAQRSSTSQLHDALNNTTPQTPIPLWTGSERENDASVSSAKKKLAVAGKNGRMRKEGRTASEDTFSVRWIGQICILRSRDRLAGRPTDRPTGPRD